jgi:hypothetical protein
MYVQKVRFRNLKSCLISHFIFLLDVARVVAVGTQYNMHHMFYLDEIPLDHIRMRHMFVRILHTGCQQPHTYT